MSTNEDTPRLRLLYTLFCDDVRLEAGNRLSYMGVFHDLIVPQIPFSLIKFAIVNHWAGEGEYLSEVRILTPDRKQPVVVSQPARFDIGRGGFANNISFFVNVAFHAPGYYWVQTLIDSTLFDEKPLLIADTGALEQQPDTSESIN